MSSGFMITIAVLIVMGVLFPLTVITGAIMSSKADHRKTKKHVFHHEAAHAVLAMKEGFGFTTISVVEDNQSMGRVKLFIHDSIDNKTAKELDADDVEIIESHLETMLAGYAVEELIFGIEMPLLKKNFGDMAAVNIVLSNNPLLYGNSIRGKEKYFNLMKDRSLAKVQEYLPMINLLAEKLKTCPEMTEGEVSDLLTQNFPSFIPSVV